MHCDRLIEDEADLLLALLRCAPARAAVGAEDRFDRKGGILGRDFDGRDLSQIHPARARLCLAVRCVQPHDSFAHMSILSHCPHSTTLTLCSCAPCAIATWRWRARTAG